MRSQSYQVKIRASQVPPSTTFILLVFRHIRSIWDPTGERGHSDIQLAITVTHTLRRTPRLHAPTTGTTSSNSACGGFSSPSASADVDANRGDLLGRRVGRLIVARTLLQPSLRYWIPLHSNATLRPDLRAHDHHPRSQAPQDLWKNGSRTHRDRVRACSLGSWQIIRTTRPRRCLPTSTITVTQRTSSFTSICVRRAAATHIQSAARRLRPYTSTDSTDSTTDICWAPAFSSFHLPAASFAYPSDLGLSEGRAYSNPVAAACRCIRPHLSPREWSCHWTASLAALKACYKAAMERYNGYVDTGLPYPNVCSSIFTQLTDTAPTQTATALSPRRAPKSKLESRDVSDPDHHIFECRETEDMASEAECSPAHTGLVVHVVVAPMESQTPTRREVDSLAQSSSRARPILTTEGVLLSLYNSLLRLLIAGPQAYDHCHRPRLYQLQPHDLENREMQEALPLVHAHRFSPSGNVVRYTSRCPRAPATVASIGRGTTVIVTLRIPSFASRCVRRAAATHIRPPLPPTPPPHMHRCNASSVASPYTPNFRPTCAEHLLCDGCLRRRRSPRPEPLALTARKLSTDEHLRHGGCG
ncbi:hypothetical protein C8R46DRAFT_1234605 [Mycena filopes]|nr:hypothetical protein C8R46DRAFT_1234605 [Mycena filopes]